MDDKDVNLSQNKNIVCLAELDEHGKKEEPKVEKDSDLYIAYLTTSASVRNQGIGTKLLEFAFEMPGYTQCYLDVLSKNISAKKLYESLGFVAQKKKFHIMLMIQRLGHLIFMKRQKS